jgi:uncharacterized integral membrane protein
MTADKPDETPTTAKPEESTPATANTELQKSETGPGAQTTSQPDRRESPAVRKQTRLSAAWVALAAGLVVLVLLLIFILQNNNDVVVKYFGAQGQLPLGVLLLFAAAGGALVVVVLGAARMFQLHWMARRDRLAARNGSASQSGSGPRRAGTGSGTGATTS